MWAVVENDETLGAFVWAGMTDDSVVKIGHCPARSFIMSVGQVWWRQPRNWESRSFIQKEELLVMEICSFASGNAAPVNLLWRQPQAGEAGGGGQSKWGLSEQTVRNRKSCWTSRWKTITVIINTTISLFCDQKRSRFLIYLVLRCQKTWLRAQSN